MSDFNLSLDGLFQRGFGTLRGQPYNGNELNDPQAARPFYDSFEEESDSGTEFVTVRDQLNARTPDGQPLFLPVRIGGVLLPNEPTISFTKSKDVVQTKMVGSKLPGTVKELISSGDWKITIRGIAINYESKQFYPEDEVKALKELDAREESLQIDCALTSLLGIYRLVILDINFPEMIGVQHAQAYEIKAVSDRDFQLVID